MDLEGDTIIKLLYPDFIFQDDRGLICQLVSKGWNQVNVVVTKAGSQRGRMHYHTQNVEAFYIIQGKIDYKCTSVQTGETARRIFSAGDFWCVEPFVGHDFQFLEDTIHISMYDFGVDLPDGTRDIIETDTKSNKI